MGAALRIYVSEVRHGEHIDRCCEPLYPAMALLSASADLVALADSRYTDAVKLRETAAELGLPLRRTATYAASEFGNRKDLRAGLREHAERVETAIAQAADALLVDRDGAAKKLGGLAAAIANNVAADQFMHILPASELPADAVIEPDRLDGRRLAKACLWSAIAVSAVSVLLGRFGISATILIPTAFLAWPIGAHLLLCRGYGLSEATRLTRSIRSFLPSGPPQPPA
ncbi:hypothetical protein ABT224_37990 [Streptomyces sp. NPDC001584]|uniref:hypothetical protein n=1 Tax=Streptomyces sp. NPDC001584 TaxID=3154521 RepID=UPI00332245F9